MKVDIQGYKTYDNDKFNDSIAAIHKLLFGDSSPIGFFKQNKNDEEIKESIKYIQPQDTNAVFIDPLQTITLSTQHLNEIESLGTAEKNLMRHLLSTENTGTIVYLGERGTGKSATIDFCVQQLIEKFHFTPTPQDLFNGSDNVIYKININHVVGGNEGSEKAVESIQMQLYNSLCAFLRSIYKHSDLYIAFEEHLISNELGDWECQFQGYIDHLSNDSEWKGKIPAEKCKVIFSWLGTIDNIHFQFDRIRDLFNYYLNINPVYSQKKICIIIDNVDSLSDLLQRKFLLFVLQFSYRTELRVIVAMRPTTFGKIGGNSSYMFSGLAHIGVDPIQILINRFEKFINEPYPEEDKNVYVKAFKERLSTINALIRNSSRLSKCIESLSGKSIRRCILLSQRLVVNNSMNWDMNAVNYKVDALIQSLLVPQDSTAPAIHEDDLAVTNLFVSDKKSSLLKLRILQVLDYHKMTNQSTKLGEVIDILNSIDEWSNDEVYNAFQDLLNVRKKLLFIYGVYNYTDEYNFYQSMNDRISISSSGHKYFTGLVFELQYIQNSFSGISWTVERIRKNRFLIIDFLERKRKQNQNLLYEQTFNMFQFQNNPKISDFIPYDSVDYTNIVHRFSFLRDAFHILLSEDLYQSIRFLNKPMDDFKDFKIEKLIVGDIIQKVSISLNRIYKTNIETTTSELTEEIKRWEDLAIMVDNWNIIIFNKSN